MRKPAKKLIIFWAIALPVLFGWLIYWQIKSENFSFFKKFLGLIPMEAQTKNEIRTASDIVEYLSKKDDQERSFLLLFQNNMELRPSGGYLGSFGILKIKNGKIVSIEAHDTNIFDGRVPDGTPTPFPMPELLGIKDWKMRDSNWFPDFKDSAQKAQYFYNAGQGQENFDGIIGLNASVLSSVLDITGPISVEGYEGEFNSENAMINLEYAVEKGYQDAGVKHADRKNILKSMSGILTEKVKNLSISNKLALLKVIEKEMNQEDIQLFFRDSVLQQEVEKIGWAGKINTDWKQDYLMINDANLGALKSDLKIKKEMEYSLDLSQEKPSADLKIRYIHTGKEKDWITKDYQGYLRVYVPDGSWLEENINVGERKFMDEYGKKVFGFIVKAPMGKTTEIEIKYTLPEAIKSQPYNLLLQKQSGVENVPVKIHIEDKSGVVHNYFFDLTREQVLNPEF
jgi:hypothetical protein